MQQKIHQKIQEHATNDSKGDCPANRCANNIDFSVAISYRGVVGYLLYE
jgi:phosphopantetheinyl transferase